MTVRLRWNQAGLDHGGAFVLREGPLFLLVAASGTLDQMHQDPGTRAGLLAEDTGTGGLRLQGRGGVGFLIQGKVRDQAELRFGKNLLCTFEQQQWTLHAEGKVLSEDPLVGTDLGGYRLLERLGNGSVGVVYRALQINLEREVAIKILDPKAAKKSPLAVASFKREAVAAGRLSHPNLVQVYDVGFERGLHFFAMELVPGGNLEQLLKQAGPLPWRQAFMHVLDCAEALRFARQHHLVHRDVKPENLMLTVDGRTKLADLGMAATRGMVDSQVAGGTPHFMAPECIQGDHIDFRSDFYSLGCTLFRLLSGETPFTGEDVRDILRAHRDDPVPHLKDFEVDAPAGVQGLLDWLMAKDPDARPADIDEVIDEMHALLETPKTSRSIVGLVVLVFIVGGIAAFSFLGDDPEPALPADVSSVGLEERERTAQLEAELAFTQAMGVLEGDLRVEALQLFLGAYPRSAFQVRALDEIERLANLPATPVTDSSNDGSHLNQEETALAAELAQLEKVLQDLLKRSLFGQAQQLLAKSSLGATLLSPLWVRVESLSAPGYAALQTTHAEAIAAEDWVGATAVRQQFAAAMEGTLRGLEELQEQLAAMDQSLDHAKQIVLQRNFDQEREDLVLAMQQQVLIAVKNLDFNTAELALRELASSCDHPQLRATVLARAFLFQDAQQAMDAIYAQLDGNGQIDITEPRDGKRAFATLANAEGVRLMVQVRGERVERLDPWQVFFTPHSLPSFLDQVLAPALAGDNSRVALLLLVTEASMASHLRDWGITLPSEAEALTTAQVVQAWLDVLDNLAFTHGEVIEAELFALQQFWDVCESLADADSYTAMLHARGMGRSFSLLSAWSSDGKATWGFTP